MGHSLMLRDRYKSLPPYPRNHPTLPAWILPSPRAYSPFLCGFRHKDNMMVRKLSGGGLAFAQIDFEYLLCDNTSLAPSLAIPSDLQEVLENRNQWENFISVRPLLPPTPFVRSEPFFEPVLVESRRMSSRILECMILLETYVCFPYPFSVVSQQVYPNQRKGFLVVNRFGFFPILTLF